MGSSYKRMKMMEQHFGAGITWRPCQAMMMPELVGGEMHEFAVEMWHDLEADVRTECLPHGVRPMTGEDWDIVI